MELRKDLILEIGEGFGEKGWIFDKVKMECLVE